MKDELSRAERRLLSDVHEALSWITVAYARGPQEVERWYDLGLLHLQRREMRLLTPDGEVDFASQKWTLGQEARWRWLPQTGRLCSRGELMRRWTIERRRFDVDDDDEPPVWQHAGGADTLKEAV